MKMIRATLATIAATAAPATHALCFLTEAASPLEPTVIVCDELPPNPEIVDLTAFRDDTISSGWDVVIETGAVVLGPGFNLTGVGNHALSLLVEPGAEANIASFSATGGDQGVATVTNQGTFSGNIRISNYSEVHIVNDGTLDGGVYLEDIGRQPRQQLPYWTPLQCGVETSLADLGVHVGPDQLEVVWKVDGQIVGFGDPILLDVGLGQHDLEILITSTWGETTVLATPTIIDTIPPEITLELLNGGGFRTRTEGASARLNLEATDLCDPSPTVTALLGGEVFDGTKLSFFSGGVKSEAEEAFTVKAEALDASGNMSTKTLILAE